MRMDFDDKYLRVGDETIMFQFFWYLLWFSIITRCQGWRSRWGDRLLKSGGERATMAMVVASLINIVYVLGAGHCIWWETV